MGDTCRFSCPARPHLTAPRSRHQASPRSVLFKDSETQASWFVISPSLQNHTLTSVSNRSKGCMCVTVQSANDFPPEPGIHREAAIS